MTARGSAEVQRGSDSPGADNILPCDQQSPVAALRTTDERLGATTVRIVGEGASVWVEAGPDFSPGVGPLARLEGLLPWLSVCNGLYGRVRLALDRHDDEPDIGLAFATRRSDVLLAPDVVSLTVARGGLRSVVPWSERKPAAVWRGGLDPDATDLRQIFASAPVELCLRARYSLSLDALLSALPPPEQFGEALETALRGLGVFDLPSMSVPPEPSRYAIDLGNGVDDALTIAQKWAGSRVLTIGQPHRTWIGEKLRALQLTTSLAEVASVVAAQERSGEGENTWRSAADALGDLGDAELGSAIYKAVGAAFARAGGCE